MHFSLTTECTFLPHGVQSYLLGRAFRQDVPSAVILANGVLHGLQVLCREVILDFLFFFLITFQVVEGSSEYKLLYHGLVSEFTNKLLSLAQDIVLSLKQVLNLLDSPVPETFRYLSLMFYVL